MMLNVSPKLRKGVEKSLLPLWGECKFKVCKARADMPSDKSAPFPFWEDAESQRLYNLLPLGLLGSGAWQLRKARL